MYKLIAAGVLFLVISVGIFGVIRSHDNKVRAAQKADDQEAITVAQTNTATCKAYNVSLQASFDVIEKDRIRQNEAVLKWQAATEEAFEISDYWRDKYKATQARYDASQRDAHAKGVRPANPNQTCQQQLDEMDADARAWLPEREAMLRDVLGLPALKVGK